MIYENLVKYFIETNKDRESNELAIIIARKYNGNIMTICQKNPKVD